MPNLQSSSNYSIEISLERIKPNPTGVLETQGIPPEIPPPPRILDLYHQAETLFYQLAAPIGIMTGITINEFSEIYKGNGNNENKTPLESIYPKADYLALFAFTLGKEISKEIERQSEIKNLALGFMLDSVASYCADKASGAAQDYFYKRLYAGGNIPEETHILLYSPGYCGWHISGQQKLFERLQPGEIGIQLNKNFLMSPLKSISGVLVAGKPEIHLFDNHYSFCSQCKTRTCRSRTGSIRQ